VYLIRYTKLFELHRVMVRPLAFDARCEKFS
jgi:hypothetical protein